MLMNLRNAMMGGKRLPYDAEVEYLETNAVSNTNRCPYIETGIYPSLTVKSEIIFQQQTYKRFTNYVFGCGGDFSSGYYGLQIINANNAFLPVLGGRNYQSVSGFSSGVIYDCIINDNKKFYANEQILYDYAESANTYDFSQSQEICVFASKYNFGTYYSSVRVYSVKIWDNDTLVRDYIPVRVGTVGYLYDRVSGKLFGNAGTGDFVLGPDVVPVEYIESHGTEWIDTGVLPTSADRFTGKFAYVGAAPDGKQYLAGANDTTIGNILMRLISSGAFNISGFGQGSINLGLYTNTLSDFVVASENFSYNGISSSLSWTPGKSIDRSLYLFARHAISLANITSGIRLGSFCIERNGVKILDLIPVRVGSGSTWDGAMMDVLTRRIYRNAGTGAFTYGNDLRCPIPTE